jgi:hypothetical protein
MRSCDSRGRLMTRLAIEHTSAGSGWGRDFEPYPSSAVQLRMSEVELTQNVADAILLGCGTQS